MNESSFFKGSPEELHEGPKPVLKHRNYLNFLNNIELGMTAGVQAEREFYQMKTSHKEETSSSNLLIRYFTNDSCEVNFIKGDDKSLFGVWRWRNDSKKHKYVMGEISYNVNASSQTYRPCKNILDMCRDCRAFLTIHTYPRGVLPSFLCLLNAYVDARAINRYLPPPWFCCCSLRGNHSVAIGGNRYFIIMNENRQQQDLQVKVRGKVLTLSEHEQSTVILAGLHTGMLSIIDPRVHSEPGYYVNVSKKAVNDSLFLNKQEVIVTDVEGKLVKVDLRTRKISAEFIGHKHSVTKRPFSAADNMLCATGADNVVRIWHVSGGRPIHVHKPTSDHEIRAWLHSDGNKTYLNYFERDTRTVFTI